MQTGTDIQEANRKLLLRMKLYVVIHMFVHPCLNAAYFQNASGSCGKDAEELRYQLIPTRSHRPRDAIRMTNRPCANFSLLQTAVLLLTSYIMPYALPPTMKLKEGYSRV